MTEFVFLFLFEVLEKKKASLTDGLTGLELVWLGVKCASTLMERAVISLELIGA